VSDLIRGSVLFNVLVLHKRKKTKMKPTITNTQNTISLHWNSGTPEALENE